MDFKRMIVRSKGFTLLKKWNFTQWKKVEQQALQPEVMIRFGGNLAHIQTKRWSNGKEMSGFKQETAGGISRHAACDQNANISPNRRGCVGISDHIPVSLKLFRSRLTFNFHFMFTGFKTMSKKCRRATSSHGLNVFLTDSDVLSMLKRFSYFSICLNLSLGFFLAVFF